MAGQPAIAQALELVQSLLSQHGAELASEAPEQHAYLCRLRDELSQAASAGQEELARSGQRAAIELFRWVVSLRREEVAQQLNELTGAAAGNEEARRTVRALQQVLQVLDEALAGAEHPGEASLTKLRDSAARAEQLLAEAGAAPTSAGAVAAGPQEPWDGRANKPS